MTPRTALPLVIAVVILGIAGSSAERRFYDDDPIAREPETRDASGVQPFDIDLLYDLSYNLFVTPRRPVANVKAQNLNTIDEVPDSSWFTNRIGSRPLSSEEILRGPDVGPPPAAGTWTVIREKSAGYAPGFTARDSQGQTWFVSFDPPSNPEGASSALVIANKIFWALGYNQVENFLTTLRPADIVIADTATVRRPSGERTRMTRGDIDEVLERAARNPDGSYRVAAGRLLEGKVLGGFSYAGTRPDDPNDVVPHEHRRELRALGVFGAWTNLTDMKALNTLDTLVTARGGSIVKHYLQDVGSTFGIGANGPHDWDEGWEYVYEGAPLRRRLLSFGFALSPWQTARYEEHDAIGRFEGDRFDPETWKPRVPTAAFLEMRDDDAFWAARRVMAFSDDLIRAIVKTGQFSDPRAEQLLAEVLIKRRDKIGRVYLTKINPIVDPALDPKGVLTFRNAAVRHGFAPEPDAYAAVWYRFDNATGESTRIADTSSRGETMPGPPGLPSAQGVFVRVALSAASAAHPSWGAPVDLYFRRTAGAWTLVGLERLPGTAKE
jgi:hypothetical protein